MKDLIVEKLFSLYEEWMAKKLSRSFVLADRHEKKARLRTVMALSVELEKIKEASIFGTGLGEAVLEDIIEGDWESAKTLAGHFRFADENSGLREMYAPMWENFVVIAETEANLAIRRARGEDVRPD